MQAMKPLDKSTEKFFDGVVALLLFIFFIICCFLFTSCKTAQWAGKKIAKIEAKQPQSLAKYCADRYQGVSKDSSTERFLPGTVEEKVDTAYWWGDTSGCCDTSIHQDRDGFLQRLNSTTRTITKTRTIHDTLVQYRKVTEQNTARVEQLTLERDQLKTEKAVLESQYKGVKKWLYIISAVALIMIVWKIGNWMNWLPF